MQQRVTEHEPGHAVVQDERAVRQVVERAVVDAAGRADLYEPLAVEPRVDRVGARLSRGGGRAR